MGRLLCFHGGSSAARRWHRDRWRRGRSSRGERSCAWRGRRKPTWRYRPPSASGGLREIARKRTEGSGRQLRSGVGSVSDGARVGRASDNASILSPVDIARGWARSARRDPARPSEGPHRCSFRGYDRIAREWTGNFRRGPSRARRSRWRERTHREPRGSSPRTTWRPLASSTRFTGARPRLSLAV